MIEPLTPREQDVYQELLKGKTQAQIAKDLVLSINTINTHVNNILNKYDVHSSLELLALRIKELTE